MMHFVFTASWKMEDTPFGAELRRLKVPHIFFCEDVSLQYYSLSSLLFRIYPKLAWFAFKMSIRSMILSRPSPTAIVVGSEVEAVVFGIIRKILRKRALIIFQPFIVSPRTSPFWDWLHQYYYRLVMNCIDLGICHSLAERAKYVCLFPQAEQKLVVIPLSTTVGRPEREVSMDCPAEAYIVAAGRSGRDYKTLVQAAGELSCELRIICDLAAPLMDLEIPENVKVIRDCFNREYIDMLTNALFVVIPLAVDDISAGQVVLLQAAACGKAIIITETKSTVEYATHEENALLVELGNVSQMRMAIERLLADNSLRVRLGTAARRRFERDHSIEAYARRLVAAIEKRASASSI